MEHPITIGSDGKIISPNAAIKTIGRIRRSLDYHGIARRILVTDPLPQGALPIYDRDIDVAAVVSSEEKIEEKVTGFQHDKIIIGTNGKIGRDGIWGRRVVVPTFQIFQNPTIRIDDVKQRRFNLIDRAVQKARQQIMAQEDADIFAALDAETSGNKEE